MPQKVSEKGRYADKNPASLEAGHFFTLLEQDRVANISKFRLVFPIEEVVSHNPGIRPQLPGYNTDILSFSYAYPEVPHCRECEYSY